MLASDKKKKFFTVRLHYSSDFLPLSDFSSDVLYLKLFFSSFVRIASETFFTWIWILFFFFGTAIVDFQFYLQCACLCVYRNVFSALPQPRE